MNTITDAGRAIRAILVDELYVEVPATDIGDDDSLRDDLGLDSLGFVELRAQCERAFGIKISEQDFSPTHFATAGTLAALVVRLAR